MCQTQTGVLLALGLTFLCYILITIRNRQRPRPLPPGPWSLPVIGNLHQLTVLPHRGLQALAQKHGPLMRLQLGQVLAVVASSPRTAQLLLKDHDTAFASRPKIQASDLMSYGSKGMAFQEYGPYWRNVRKLCTLKLLSAARIESFAALRKEEIGALVRRAVAAAEAGEAMDISRRVGETVADIAARMILGPNADDRYKMKKLVKEALCLIGAFNIADFVPYLKPFDIQGLAKPMKKTGKAIDEILEKIFVEHEKVASMKSPEHPQTDFVDVLLSVMNKPLNPQDEHVYIIDRTNCKAIILDMIVAAFDTSATSVEWTFSELLKNPRVMKKLQVELASVVGLDRMVEENDLSKLYYLDMVVKESYRLHPIGPLLVPRESRQDIIIDGYHIPKKSRIIVNAWAIGRDPNVWSNNVEDFYPERFIEKSIDLRGHDFELLPFGSGRRGCPGMQMGLTIFQICLAQLVHCFNWELPNGMKPEDLDMDEKFGLSTGRAHPLFAKPTYRLSSNVACSLKY